MQIKVGAPWFASQPPLNHRDIDYVICCWDVSRKVAVHHLATLNLLSSCRESPSPALPQSINPSVPQSLSPRAHQSPGPKVLPSPVPSIDPPDASQVGPSLSRQVCVRREVLPPRCPIKMCRRAGREMNLQGGLKCATTKGTRRAIEVKANLEHRSVEPVVVSWDLI